MQARLGLKIFTWLALGASFYVVAQTIPTLAKEPPEERATAISKLPNKILWAWKRAEDLSTIDPHKFGVAYLACHVFIDGDKVKWETRNQPLKIPPHTVVVPTIRIDIVRREKPVLSEQQIEKIAWHIGKAASVPNAAAIQIDFDALETERGFYRSLLRHIKKTIPSTMPISITALASWCLFDNWIADLPIDESVPMMFSLGRDRDKVLLYLQKHHDFIDERANRSLGLSLEDTGVNELMIPIARKRKIPVRVYVFTRTAWTEKKIRAVNSLLGKL
ncbi:MAG TPA: hypothetical protein EYN91_21490 [Candidatus Melainabacteria bacterium]|jgi:hypothetical protein|nr:hypothetical protein [Candidatus Melainabacteria bacterium]HIN66485.1 hypothetical protein [Candidatus Obscuribacterales bacterium]